MEKILVVDDEQVMSDLFSFMLERAGYAPAVAGEAKKALELVAAEEYPVVLTDLMMPGMDGLQLMNEIHKLRPDTQVIMITASTGIDSAVEAVKRGAFAYLSKPAKNEELTVTVKNAVEHYRLLREKARIEQELLRRRQGDTVYALLVIDAAGKIKNANKATEQMLGYIEGELTGRPASEIFGSDFAATPLYSPEVSRKSEGLKVGFVRRGGEKVDMLFSGTVLYDASHQTTGIVGMFRMP
jgi:PAS domain S-box-containing protein